MTRMTPMAYTSRHSEWRRGIIITKMGRQHGFTIVEVTIFLAISGVLLLMAVLGSGEMARRARFTDTVDRFNSYLQRQYEEVFNGVNGRSAGAGGCTAGSSTGGDSCILIGKVISFSPGATTVTSRYLRTSVLTIDTTKTLYEQIKDAAPQAIATASQTQELGWGATFQEASRNTARSNAAHPQKSASRANINAVAFIRSPESARLLSYYFYYPGANTLANVQTGLTIAVADYSRASQSAGASLCIYNTQDWGSLTRPVAAVAMVSGRGSAGITTNYQPTRGSTTQLCGT